MHILLYTQHTTHTTRNTQHTKHQLRRGMGKTALNDMTACHFDVMAELVTQPSSAVALRLTILDILCLDI